MKVTSPLKSTDFEHNFISVTEKRKLSLTKAATGGVLSKEVLLKISQYLQQNTCVGVSF